MNELKIILIPTLSSAASGAPTNNISHQEFVRQIQARMELPGSPNMADMMSMGVFE